MQVAVVTMQIAVKLMVMGNGRFLFPANNRLIFCVAHTSSPKNRVVKNKKKLKIVIPVPM
jgi:hypothetical protein